MPNNKKEEQVTEENRFRGPLNRPHWLSAEEWAKLLAVYNHMPYCEECGRVDWLSVDHIVPQVFGGSDDLSNLQFLCVPCNSAKGSKPDNYWSRTFYWDQQVNLDGMRSAQRRVYEMMVADPLLSDWYRQPISQIAGRLNTMCMVVAAGKTVLMPVISFAYNRLQLSNDWPAMRRADQILVLTKEQAIRDQTAADLSKNLTEYGIAGTNPRVAVLNRYEDLLDERWLSQYDVVVACVQMFWHEKGQPQRDVMRVLDQFPLIFVDEPHFGPGQVRKFLDLCPRSLVFGLTGSPIEGSGQVLADYVKVAQFTYQDSDFYDNGVKYLDQDSLVVVELDEADVLNRGVTVTVNDAKDRVYDGNGQLIPIHNVVSAAIRWMERCDAVLPHEEPAPHRKDGVVTDVIYPVHIMIRVPSKQLAQQIHNDIEARLGSNRGRWPKSGGWASDYVLTEDAAKDIKGQRLNPDHPWFSCWKRGPDANFEFKCKSGDVRILIVVGMGREGTNNPLDAANVVADGTTSLTNAVQSPIGRALRSVTFTDKAGALHVPPRLLDTVKIFVHEDARETVNTLRDGIDFVLNMEDHLDGLITINDLIEGKAIPSVHDDEPIPNFSNAERMRIAHEIQITEPNWRSDDSAFGRLMSDILSRYAKGDDKKASKVSDYLNSLRTEPQDAWRKMGHAADLKIVPVILNERELHKPSDEELVEFQSRRDPLFKDDYNNSPADFRPRLLNTVRPHYTDWANQRILPESLPTEKLEAIRRAMVFKARSIVEPYLRAGVDPNDNKFKGLLHAKVGKAVQLTLGTDETVGQGTQWDCAPVHTILYRLDIEQQIISYAVEKAVRAGYCPTLAASFGIDVD